VGKREEAGREPDMGWSTPLAREVIPRSTRKPTKPGKPLRTLADARAYVLCLPIDISARQAWQQLSKLLLEASEHGDTTAATEQLHLALFLENRLWLAASKPSG
jgi:hypothetical protein